MSSEPPRTVIISGPTTIGKNTLIDRLCRESGARFIVPYTTRPIRREEANGRDYHFIEKADFQAKIGNGKIGEWDFTLGHYYGFDVAEISEGGITHALARMALRIRGSIEGVKTVFLYPQNADAHFARMRTRFPNSAEFETRKGHFNEELIHSSMFDFLLKVGGAEDALAESSKSVWERLGFKLSGTTHTQS